LPSDEPGTFERQHHLVNRRRADAKKFLHVGFGRERWKREPIAFIEEVLHTYDIDTQRLAPFKLHDAQRQFLKYAWQTRVTMAGCYTRSRSTRRSRRPAKPVLPVLTS